MATRVVSISGGRKKGKVRTAGKHLARKPKKKSKRKAPEFTTPYPKRKAVIEDWKTGLFNQRELAIKHDLSEVTIHRIVNGSEAGKALESTSQALSGMAEEELIPLLVARAKYELKNRASKMGAVLCLELLERYRGIPAKIIRRQEVEPGVDPSKQSEGTQDERVDELVKNFVRLGFETRRAYGEKLPSPKQLEEEFEKKRTIDIPLVEVEVAHTEDDE